MSIEAALRTRADNQCELCSASGGLAPYLVSPKSEEALDTCALLCSTCRTELDGPPEQVPDYWRCLGASMWSAEPPVQVLVWRLLDQLSHAPWAQDLASQLYLEDSVLEWAQAGAQGAAPGESGEVALIHKDSNGAVLAAGDTVTLIKDLPVKGAGFTAKRGTAVRNISLVPDNAAHIEGRVEGQQIVILTEFVKKAG